MTTPSAAETTGEIVIRRTAGGIEVDAPMLAAIPIDDLFDLPRVPGVPRAVQFPAAVRYRIGARHRIHAGAVYLHLLP